MEKRKLIFCAIPKELHYAKNYIMKYVIEEDHAPISAYGISFWLLDTIKRDKIREINNYYILRCDELWVFATDYKKLADGVLKEIQFAKSNNKKVYYFYVNPDSQKIAWVEKLPKELKEVSSHSSQD